MYKERRRQTTHIKTDHGLNFDFLFEQIQIDSNFDSINYLVTFDYILEFRIFCKLKFQRLENFFESFGYLEFAQPEKTNTNSTTTAIATVKCFSHFQKFNLAEILATHKLLRPDDEWFTPWYFFIDNYNVLIFGIFT